MKTNTLQQAKRLTTISEMADNSLIGGLIDKTQHAEIKGKALGLELDNLFKAMADYCNQ